MKQRLSTGDFSSDLPAHKIFFSPYRCSTMVSHSLSPLSPDGFQNPKFNYEKKTPLVAGRKEQRSPFDDHPYGRTPPIAGGKEQRSPFDDHPYGRTPPIAGGKEQRSPFDDHPYGRTPPIAGGKEQRSPFDDHPYEKNQLFDRIL